MSAETATYGGLVDAIGGIATVVLAIVALAGVVPQMLLPVAVIVFGAALLIEGGTMLSEYALVLSPKASASSSEPHTRIEHFDGGGLSSLFLMGVAGIVLGVLALLGIGATELTLISGHRLRRQPGSQQQLGAGSFICSNPQGREQIRHRVAASSSRAK